VHDSALVDEGGRPIAFILTSGQVADIIKGAELLLDSTYRVTAF
jgi:hypothetical protein